MRRDFEDDVLPFSGPMPGYLPGTGFPAHSDKWADVYRVVDRLLHTCVRERRRPGWALLGYDIVVAFWPRASYVDQIYGLGPDGVGKLINVNSARPIKEGEVGTS